MVQRLILITMAAVSLSTTAPASARAADESAGRGWIDLNKNGAKDVYEDPAAPIDARIEDLLRQMTLEEKLGQLAQYAGTWSNNGPRVPEGGEDDIRAGRAGSFLNVFGAGITRDMQRLAIEESRLGVPLLFAHDVVHGFRTTFPVPLAEAASWDTAAVEGAARVAATEAAAHGLHWTFAPMVDIARDPRWGRIVEGAGEDPYLGSRMATARVRGFQGNKLGAPDSLLACAKHFAAYGAAEGGRDYNTADVSERTLREIYFPPFHAAVEAGAATFMAAFNEIAGVPCHANPWLLDDVLRGEWGFDGLVVSDWSALDELRDHGVAADPVEAGILTLRAGVDIDMVSDYYERDLPDAVGTGRLDQEPVDKAVRRVLRAKFLVGLFDDPYRFSDPAREAAHTLTAENRAAARRMAQQSIVLLKNEAQTLPLSKKLRTLAVIGPLADDRAATLGPWAAAGRPEDAVSIHEGIRAAVTPSVTVLHVRGSGVNDRDTSGFAEAERAAREADAVVLVLGEDATMSGEARSRSSLDLPGVQGELDRAVRAAADSKPLAVVLMNGRPLSVAELDETMPAILETWFLGIEMGHAVADVLFGEVNPSGKLPVTFPRTVGQVPIHYNHKRTGRPADAHDSFTAKYIDVPWTPLYAFGHGLSYTRFAYSDLTLSTKKVGTEENVTVRVTLRNTGDRAGAEVVQLYLRDEVASTTRPVRELRGFERVDLAPGESREVSFELTPDDLACLDTKMQRTVEAGWFTVFVGGSSTAELSARFEVVPAAKADVGDEAFLEDLSRRTFDWFWETTNPANGLAPDRGPGQSFASVAAVGFALSAYPIGVERGYITRAEAVERTHATLKFFADAPQGDAPTGMTGHRGFFYHFLDMQNGSRFEKVELSTVDTALFLGGALFCQSYFNRAETADGEIRELVDRIYRRVEWDWAVLRGNLICMGWHPESGFIGADYRGYDEAMLLYILALGSPTHPIRPESWTAFTHDYTWATFHGQEHVNFAPLFGHQYSHAWVDFRGIQDAYMRGKGIDYFENSRRATLAQRAYAMSNPGGWAGYGPEIWGLTACDGPADVTRPFNGRQQVFRTYSARGAGADYINDDGTIAPTAAGGSIAFAPEIAIPALKAMLSRYGEALYTRHGFLDAINPSFTFPDVKLQHGRIVPGLGWFDTQHLGIDQGPILMMLENHRSGLIWDTMRRNAHLMRGLRRAGFAGGWLGAKTGAAP